MSQGDTIFFNHSIWFLNNGFGFTCDMQHKKTAIYMSKGDTSWCDVSLGDGIDATPLTSRDLVSSVCMNLFFEALT